MTLNPYLTPYTKIKSKSINLIEEQKNRNHKTSKTKHWSILLVNGFSNEFLSDIRNKDNKWKEIKKLGYMTLKRFYTVKETIKKMKKQPRQWEKIFASHICDKGLVSKIYKKLIQLNTIQWVTTDTLFKGNEIISQRYLYPHINSNISHRSQCMVTTWCPSMNEWIKTMWYMWLYTYINVICIYTYMNIIQP